MQWERADDGRLAGTKRPHQQKKLVHACIVLKAMKEWWMRNVRVWLFTESNTLSKIQHQSSPRLISYKNPVLIDWMGRGTFNVGNPKPCFYLVNKHSRTSWINRHLWSIGQDRSHEETARTISPAQCNFAEVTRLTHPLGETWWP